MEVKFLKFKMGCFLTGFLCFFLVSLNSCDQSSKQNEDAKVPLILPTPSAEFMDSIKDLYDKDQLYLSKYIKADGAKDFIKDTLFGDEFSFIQKFKGDIVMTYQGVESGVLGHITFPGYRKKELIKFVNWFYKVLENDWDKDSSNYYPTDEGAGCYYTIDKDSLNQYFIEYYCGC